MAKEAIEQRPDAVAWQSTQVYAMAAICLVIGLAVGYLFRGSRSPVSTVPSAGQANAAAASMGGHMGGQMPTLEQMKLMADKKAAPLLEKLKTDPNNSDTLFQIGNIYKATHQFTEAASYYDQALKIDPKNIAIRTEMASCLYYNGDTDGAIAQLQQSLQYAPKDANSLFNIGVMKLQGKQDAKGALAAWQELLKSNPNLAPDRKANVQKLIEEVRKRGASGLTRELTGTGPATETKD